MLLHLSIRNYALIDELNLDFQKGFSTITGETGSGKSILLGGLGLILGERADIGALDSKAKKCVIEGHFDLRDYAQNYILNNFFEKYDLDYADVSIVRREITSSGKSRSFINDTPVNLNQLKELSEQLVDIHSQHQTLRLNKAGYQLQVVDAFAGTGDLLRKYNALYVEHRQLKQELEALQEQERQSKLDQDYWQFQFDELNNAQLNPTKDDALEEELNTLNSSEDILRSLSQAHHLISESDQNLLTGLYEAKSMLAKLGNMTPALQEISQRLESSYVELQDIASELEMAQEDVKHDPERIQELTNRIDLLNGLQQKHRVSSIQELEEIRDGLAQQLQAIDSIDHRVEELSSKVKKAAEQLKKLGGQLTNKRLKAVEPMEAQMVELLTQLAMPNARLKVDHQPRTEAGPEGFDEITFLFRANKGGSFKPIAKVASGGELSRVMLTIKALIAKLSTLPTIIFDEIDTGISGDVADKAGNIMREMATNMQVLSITHLPQIASKGHQHYKVWKDNSGAATVTKVEALTESERIDEIAKMLSGEQLTDAARENAKVLLQQ